jgi:hypothetical protein
VSEAAEKILKFLIREMDANGWKLMGVYDGEDTVHLFKEQEVVDLVMDLDISTIFFKKGDLQSEFVSFIPENGTDCICDYSVKYPKFEEVMDKVQNYVDLFE